MAFVLEFFIFLNIFGSAVQLGGFYFPDQGLNTGPWQGKHRELTIGPPGNSLEFFFFLFRQFFSVV